MILGSKHVGGILNVLMQKFYIYALVGVLIKWSYEMHGVTIKKTMKMFEVSLFTNKFNSKETCRETDQ